MDIFSGFPAVIHASSKKEDGNMAYEWGERDAVLANREAFLRKNGVEPEDIVVMQVEHKEKIIEVGASHKNTLVIAEAFITKEKGVALFLPTADCLPVALYDPVQEVIALLHLGWRPSELGLASKTVARLQKDFRSSPADILVSIGPGISKDSYTHKDPAQKASPRWKPFLRELTNGETSIDLAGFNRAEFLQTGILPEHIATDLSDTAASSEYFSHFRSVGTGEREGRIATVLAMRQKP